MSARHCCPRSARGLRGVVAHLWRALGSCCAAGSRRITHQTPSEYGSQAALSLVLRCRLAEQRLWERFERGLDAFVAVASAPAAPPPTTDLVAYLSVR